MLTPRIQRAKKNKVQPVKTRGTKRKNRNVPLGDAGRHGEQAQVGKTQDELTLIQSTEQEHMKVKLQSKTGNQSHKLKHDEQIHL